MSRARPPSFWSGGGRISYYPPPPPPPPNVLTFKAESLHETKVIYRRNMQCTPAQMLHHGRFRARGTRSTRKQHVAVPYD